MKTNLTIFLLLAIILFACEDEPIGKWDDNILLSSDEVSLISNSDSTTVTTGGEGWWLIGLRTDEGAYYEFDEIDVFADNYTITRDDLTVERVEKTTIKIKVDKNTAEEDRTFYIDLQYGNYFDAIIINQSAN